MQPPTNVVGAFEDLVAYPAMLKEHRGKEASDAAANDAHVRFYFGGRRRVRADARGKDSLELVVVLPDDVLGVVVKWVKIDRHLERADEERLSEGLTMRRRELAYLYVALKYS